MYWVFLFEEGWRAKHVSEDVLDVVRFGEDGEDCGLFPHLQH